MIGARCLLFGKVPSAFCNFKGWGQIFLKSPYFFYQFDTFFSQRAAEQRRKHVWNEQEKSFIRLTITAGTPACSCSNVYQSSHVIKKWI